MVFRSGPARAARLSRVVAGSVQVDAASRPARGRAVPGRAGRAGGGCGGASSGPVDRPLGAEVPEPGLARLEAADHRVTGVGRVAAGVPARRRVAAADVPALRAAAEVEPPAAGPPRTRRSRSRWAAPSGSIPSLALSGHRAPPADWRTAWNQGSTVRTAPTPRKPPASWRPEDTLEDPRGVRDVLDTGWSPPERPWAVDDWGTTEAEEAAGESLDGRLARELPDRLDDEGDGLGDTSDTDGELLDDEVGDGGPAGWWTPTTAAPPTPTTSCTPGTQGIDGAAASAEEAACTSSGIATWRTDGGCARAVARLALEPRGSSSRTARRRSGTARSSSAARPDATGAAMDKPVLLSVDDDPGVSRAVARDLRRRYGEEFRVLRASSGDGGAGRPARAEAARRRGGGAARRLPDAADERHRVPRAGDGPVPAGPAGAAHRLRRHRRRHPGDQRRRRRRLPAQAVGSAGGEALSGRRRDDQVVAGQSRHRPSRTSSSSGTAGRRRRSARATSWPATPCPTAGTASTSRRGSGCWRRRTPARTTSRSSSRPTRTVLLAPTDVELAGGRRAERRRRRRTSTT